MHPAIGLPGPGVAQFGDHIRHDGSCSTYATLEISGNRLTGEILSWHMGRSCAKENLGMRYSDGGGWMHIFCTGFLLLMLVSWLRLRGAVKLAWCGVRDRYHGRASQLEATFECARRDTFMTLKV